MLIPIKFGKWTDIGGGWHERTLMAGGYSGFEAKTGLGRRVYRAAIRKSPVNEPHITLNGDEHEMSPEFDSSYKAQSWFREQVRNRLGGGQ